MIKLYTDAAFKNGKSAAGILIVKNGQQFQQKFALNEKDNHAAEFAAAAKGFEQIKKIAQENEAIFFYTDSKIVFDSLSKHYSKSYQEQLARLEETIRPFSLMIPNQISDKENRGAHELALQEIGRAHV